MKYRLFSGGGKIAFFCLVITRINSTFVTGNDLPNKAGFCFQGFGIVFGSETEIPGAENRIARDSFCGQPLVAARQKSHKSREGLWSMPFSQIRYILLHTAPRESKHRAANRYATESSPDLKRSAREFYGRIRWDRNTGLLPQAERHRTCKQDRQTKGAPGALQLRFRDIRRDLTPPSNYVRQKRRRVLVCTESIL